MAGESSHAAIAAGRRGEAFSLPFEAMVFRCYWISCIEDEWIATLWDEVGSVDKVRSLEWAWLIGKVLVFTARTRVDCCFLLKLLESAH